MPAAHRSNVEWNEWMRAMGRFTRRLRLLTGASQADLARRAGVSQAAVSRLEAGRGRNTPMVVVQRIHLAMREGLATLPPGVLSPALRRLMQVPVADGSVLLLRELIAELALLPIPRRRRACEILRTVGDAFRSAESASGVQRERAVTKQRTDDTGSSLGGPRPEPASMSAWMQSLGRTVRDLRGMAGLSQDDLARRAAVSQAALSRYEVRAASTPMVVVMKVNAALRREIAAGRLPSARADVRRLTSLEGRGIPRTIGAFEAFEVTMYPELEMVMRVFWKTPARHRSRLVDVARSLVSLASSGVAARRRRRRAQRGRVRRR